MYLLAPDRTRHLNSSHGHRTEILHVLGLGASPTAELTRRCASSEVVPTQQHITSYPSWHRATRRRRATPASQVAGQRYYSVHIFRVIVIMALFSLAAIAALVPDPEVNSIERFGVSFTLLLTTAA